MVKTAVIGASGFLGSHFLAAYRAVHPDCVGTAFSRVSPGLSHLDIAVPDIAPLQLERSGHRAVLIASGRPGIKYCEEHKDDARSVNVDGTLEMVRQIGRTSMQLIYLSSDHVFVGTAGDYDDDAPLQPTTEYGRQKAAVEQAIPALASNFLILRLSKVFGTQKGDGTLLDEMAQSFHEGRPVQAAGDQYFCPTLVDDIVNAVISIQDRAMRGVMNVCSPERWSRYDVAMALARAMGVPTSRVTKIGLHDLPSFSNRPLNTTMICSRLNQAVGATFTPLRACINKVAAQWTC